jgi:hypothetical protein
LGVRVPPSALDRRSLIDLESDLRIFTRIYSIGWRPNYMPKKKGGQQEDSGGAN